MTKDKREKRRHLRILQYADEIGSVVKACHYLALAVPVSTVGDKLILNTVWLI